MLAAKGPSCSDSTCDYSRTLDFSTKISRSSFFALANTKASHCYRTFCDRLAADCSAGHSRQGRRGLFERMCVFAAPEAQRARPAVAKSHDHRRAGAGGQGADAEWANAGEQRDEALGCGDFGFVAAAAAVEWSAAPAIT
jgi:hypothetical protein